MNFGKMLPLAAVAVLSGCGSSKSPVPLKYAVLRFENLTSDRNLDWVGRAASEVLAKAIGAVSITAIYQAQQPSVRRPALAPGISTEISGAKLAGATRIISGYYELAQGKLLFSAIEEDASTGKSLKNITAVGDVISATKALAAQFTANPKTYSTSNEAALRDAITAIESPTPNEDLFRKAVAEDPRYEEAYIGWAELALARKDRGTLEQIVEQAKANGLREITLARLGVASSSFSPDPRDREKALLRLAAADPSDKTVLRGIGDAELASHQFKEAAGHYAQAADAEHPDIYNMLSYAKMFAGDEKGALAACRQFQSLRPEDPNAIDTQGDVEYYFGRFADAEKSYQRAATKDPNFNRGAEIWKAARAHLMTGDVAGATEIFNRFLGERTKAQDASAPFRAAEWKFLTGARAKGVADMLQYAGSTPNPALKSLAFAQAAIWQLHLGQRDEARRNSQLVIAAGQNPSLVQAAIVQFSAQEPTASAAEWRLRAEKVFQGAGGVQLRELAVAYALFISGQFAEAAPLWKSIYEAANPNDQAAAFLYAGASKKSGRDQDAAGILSRNPIPSANLAAGFECLYFPQLFEWRGNHATFLKLLPAGIEAPPR